MTPIKREKGTKDRALPDGQDEHNRQKPMVQSGVEHAVGCMGQPMGGLLFRRDGMIKAKPKIASATFLYIMCRPVKTREYRFFYCCIMGRISGNNYHCFKNSVFFYLSNGENNVSLQLLTEC